MIPLFTEPLEQLTAEHVHTLVSESVPEGQTVEFKRTLPAKGGGTDPWLDGGDSVGDRARNDVLKEVVAFANSGGGNVVLGIVESDDHPKRAADVNPLPRCHELADRLRLAARDCIDPQLPAIEVSGIPSGDNDAGFVLFRVPPSRLAPHRLKPTRHCYVRRADRSEEMTMPEIQDTSVRLARGGEDIERRMEQSRERYMDLAADGWGDGRYEVGVRVTVVPVGGSIFIDKIYRNDELRILRSRLKAAINGTALELYLPLWPTLEEIGFRPVLRGARRVADLETKIAAQAIYSDGLAEFFYKHADREKPIYMGWVLGMAANALLVADTVRKIAGVPGAELILDVELRCVVHHSGNILDFHFLIEGREEERRLWTGERPRPLRLPMQSIGGSDEFEDALRRLLDDLRNVCEEPHVGQFEVEF